MKRTITLTESDIRRMVMESLNEVVKPDYWDPAWDHLAQDMENDYKKRHPEEQEPEKTQPKQKPLGSDLVEQMKKFWNGLSSDKKNILIRIVLMYITKGKFRL